MTRSYAIAFILTTLSLFGGLFYLQHQVLTQRQAATFAYAEAVQQRTIEQKRKQLDELVWRIRDRLQDESKAKYRPIQPFIELARAGEEELIAAAGALAPGGTDGLQQLLHLRENLLAALSDSAAGLLKAYGHQMNLSPEEIEAKSASYRKRIAQINIPPAADFTESAYTLQRDLIVLDYLNVLEGVLLDVTQISGGKMICGENRYFPIFNTDIVNPRKGQTERAKVSIGSYSSSLNPENVLLTAGSDTLTLNPDGTADYQFTPGKRGTHIVDLNFEIRNPLTGEIKSGKGIYTYNVH